MKGKTRLVQIAKVRTSIGARWSGLHQQHALQPPPCTMDQIRTNMTAVGVTDAAINATCVSEHHLTLRKLYWLLHCYSDYSNCTCIGYDWSVVVVVVVIACCWCSPLQLAPMLVLTFYNLWWWWWSPAATCTGCVLSSSHCCKYSTCTCTTFTV